MIAAAMNLTFQRTVDRYLGAVICRLLSWSARLSSKVPRLPSTPSIMVILLSEMGSLVLARPLFEKLKAMWPDARLFALVFERNHEALQLLGDIPPENTFRISDRTLTDFTRDSLKAILEMRRTGIDAVIDAELFARLSSIFAFLSGAGIRAGFHPHTQEGLYRGDFINRAVLYNPYQHFSVQLLSLADAITSTTMPRNKKPPAETPAAPPLLPIAEIDIQKTRDRLTADFPQIGLRRLVLIHPGGGILPIRAWPLKNYVQISRRLLECDFAIGVIGLESDKSLAEEIIRQSGHRACLDLTGYTPQIIDLLRIFHLADLLITNDGGPGHLATLTPLRTIMLFGPETPALYRPLGEHTRIFYQPVACSPCLTAFNHRNSPCDGDNICMQMISSDRIFHEALSLLNN
jgi:ADP-heptose:LPS heptosyltransferase